MPILQRRVLCIVLASVFAGTAHAQQADDDELALAYGDKSSVTIATGGQQDLVRAPAVASVITKQDIEAIGATDLDQVLETVPGLHVSYGNQFSNPRYEFRGIATAYNPQVLMLVNGIPINTVFIGNRGQLWGGMPLENVARIEVIRGPGSALYGADAFSGVINIITKTANDVKGTEYGLRAGSFSTRDGWIQYGGNLGPLDAAIYLRAGHTDGSDAVIEKDAQTFLDSLFGTHASLAPGRINAVRNAIDFHSDLAYGEWRFRAGYQKREVGIGAGLAEALDPYSRASGARLYVDLTYHNTNWAPDWDVTGVLGYYNNRERPGDPPYMLFPPGAFGGVFPDGVFGNPGNAERHYHGSVSAFYTGLRDQRIRLGAGFRVEDLYEAVESKNFNFVSIPGVGPVFMPLPGMVDATGNPALIYLEPHKRHVSYVYAQDEWKISKDWALTAGVRHDQYSDFGSTTNPRLALVWDAAYNVIVKAMHGEAFRAPSFQELYNMNNPVAKGNPNLRPETIATSELAISWQPSQTLQTNLNLFHYRMKEIIRFVADVDPSTGFTTQNSGQQTGRGIEVEATWDLSRSLRLTGGYSVQHSTDSATGHDAGLAPHRHLLVRADWRFAPLWQLGGTANYVADRAREPGDTRPQVPDYTTVGLSLRREKVAGNWQLRATVTNLFNRDAREPTLAPGNIPLDLPLPGRALMFEFMHRL